MDGMHWVSRGRWAVLPGTRRGRQGVEGGLGPRAPEEGWTQPKSGLQASGRLAARDQGPGWPVAGEGSRGGPRIGPEA